MDSSKQRTPSAAAGPWTILGLLSAAGPACYGLGLWAASLADGRGPGQLVCFDPAIPHHFTSGRVISATAMAAGATMFLVVTPWILGTLAIGRMETRRATAGAWSLAVNSIALVLVFLVLRNTVEIGRASFLAAWLAWTGVLLLLAGKSAHCVTEIRSGLRRWGSGLAIGLAAVVLAGGLFHREQFLQCFNGDGVETFELARSLRIHFLPYWEMEWVGRFGTDITNPSLINSYWTCALQLLLGEGELATRLSYWVWLLGIFAASLHMAGRRKSGANWPAAVPLAVLVFLAAVWYTFYVGWYPYMADLANPGVTDALFTLCLLLALDCLREKDLAGWVVLMLLGSLVLYAGAVMFAITSAAALVWQPVPRRIMFRAILAGTAALSGLVVFYMTWGWLDGSISGWWPTIYEDYVDCYIRCVPRFRSALLFAAYFLMGCGGLPALGLVRPFSGKLAGSASSSDIGWERTAATVTVIYLLIVLGGGVKNLHYLGPLMPIPVILWLRSAEGAGKRAAARAVVVVSAAVPLIFCIWLCWPASRAVFKLNRQIGALTTFQTDSYVEACRWLRADEVTVKLYRRRHFGWYVGQHTWLHYSQLDAAPAERRPLVVTDGGAPCAEYEPVFEWGDGLGLYCCKPEYLRWAARKSPASGPDRCPKVFQPIAISPLPRSNH